MSAIDLLGYRDGGYVVRLDKAEALIPDDLLKEKLGGNVTAAAAEEWISAVSHDIADAIRSGKGRDGLDRIRILKG